MDILPVFFYLFDGIIPITIPYFQIFMYFIVLRFGKNHAHIRGVKNNNGVTIRIIFKNIVNKFIVSIINKINSIKELKMYAPAGIWTRVTGSKGRNA